MIKARKTVCKLPCWRPVSHRLPVQAGETPAPDGAKVYFINLKDGDTVANPVKIQFGLSGMGVAPAGVEDKKNTGHHQSFDRTPPWRARRSTRPIPGR